MRSLLISLVLLVLSVQADDFKGQKVTLGKRKCTCDFRLDMKEACKGTAKCDKKCSGAGKVEVGGCSFVLQVKKGAGKISKCACDAAQPTIGPVTGSGSGPEPPTGSGSGPSPPIGSGSGEQPVPLPGSGSGPQPPAGGESMQCGCKCDCPQGTGECDCDCNCPMNSQAVNCAPGFSKVCPMMGDQCPEYMEQVCPSMPTTMPLPAGRMMGAGDRGCQCVPDFLLSLVMGAMTPAGRSAAVDRAMTKVTFKIGKTTCKCQYEINPNDCKRSKMACDKKCNGKISGLELEDGNYVMSLMVKKGKVAIQKCEAKTTEPTGTGGGPGSGPGNGGGSGMGSGPGTGMGGGMSGMGTRCACVSMGGGPMPPTGSGSGPNPPTGTGSGSGPEPPTGSGSSSSSCSAKVSWTKKSVFNGFDKYEVFGVPAFCEVGGNKNKCQHMLSVLAAYIDNNNDGCPDNPPAFLNNIKMATLPAEEPGVGAVILTKKMSFSMPAGFQKYYGLTMWEDETRPECSGTQATDSCRDASLEEVFHLLTDKGYGPTWPSSLGLYSSSNSNLTRAMDMARNPPSGAQLLKPSNGAWSYPSGAWYKHPDPTCQYNRCQTTEYHWHTMASYLGMYAGTSPGIPYTLNTKEKMVTGDPLAVAMIEDTTTGYRHPTVAPTGTYTGCSTCSATSGDTTSHGGTS